MSIGGVHPSFHPLRFPKPVPRFSTRVVFFMGRFSSGDKEFNRKFPAGGDYSRIFADAPYSVVADTPWDRKNSHRFHRYL